MSYHFTHVIIFDRKSLWLFSHKNQIISTYITKRSHRLTKRTLHTVPRTTGLTQSGATPCPRRCKKHQGLREGRGRREGRWWGSYYFTMFVFLSLATMCFFFSLRSVDSFMWCTKCIDSLPSPILLFSPTLFLLVSLRISGILKLPLVK